MTKNSTRAAATMALLGWACASALAAAPSGLATAPGPGLTHQMVAATAAPALDMQETGHDKDAGSAEPEPESAPMLTGNRLCMLLAGLGALGLLTRRRGI